MSNQMIEAKDDRELTPFGKMFRELRLKAKLTQVTVATRASVSTGYVGLIETGGRGSKPSLDVVKRFATALNCNFDETEDLMRASGWLGQGQTLIQTEQPTVESVVTVDPVLSDWQKQVLIAVYHEMVGNARS